MWVGGKLVCQTLGVGVGEWDERNWMVSSISIGVFSLHL